MTASAKPSFRVPWRVGNAVVGRGNAGWTTSKSGHSCPCPNCSQWLPAEKTGRGSLLNLSLPPNDPTGEGTELIFKKKVEINVTGFLKRMHKGRPLTQRRNLLRYSYILMAVWALCMSGFTHIQTQHSAKVRRRHDSPHRKSLFHLRCISLQELSPIVQSKRYLTYRYFS